MESSDGIRNQNSDADPLLAFVEEAFAPDAVPQNSEHSSATTAPVDQDLVAVLRNRIADAESVIKKSQDTIAALHTRVETLVCSVADLNKRLDREREFARERSAVPVTRPEVLPSRQQRVLPHRLPSRDWSRLLPRDWSRMLLRHWSRVRSRDWPRALPHRSLRRHDWDRVLPRDRQQALVLGTALVMGTLAIALVALLQAIETPVAPVSASTTRSGLASSPAVAADTSALDQPPTITAARATTLAPQQRGSPVAQRVRTKLVAPTAGESETIDPTLSGQAASAPPVTARSANVTAAPARNGQYVGTLSIDSEPSGEAFVNRRRVGRTPVTVEDLRAGSHLIWIEREGYRRFTRVVTVPANRVSRVSTELEPVER